MSLLYVEDDRLQRLVMSKILAIAGLFSIQCEHPSVAYHLHCSFPYDIILLDYWLRLTT